LAEVAQRLTGILLQAPAPWEKGSMNDCIYIHLAVPSLKAIKKMDDKERLQHLLKCACNSARDINNYIEALQERLKDLII
jgi:hypothetical protein